MNRVLHKILFLLFGVTLMHLPGNESEAAIYKWKDESGKIYFTDDINRVPEEFRKEHFKRKLPSPIPKSKSPIKVEEISNQEKEGAISENQEEIEKESQKDEELTAAEKSAAEAVIAFFKEDIPRYDRLYKIPPSYGNTGIRKWRKLKSAVVSTIPQKQTLMKQVSISERPLFKKLTLFFQKTIEADEKIAKRGIPISKNTRPIVNRLSSRLQSQAASEEKFIEQLEEALAGSEDPEKK